MKNHPSLSLLLACIFSALLMAGCGIPTQGNVSAGGFKGEKVSANDCGYGGEIKSVEALDESTVRFTLCQPDSAFPEKLSSPIFAIQDSEFLTQNGGDSNKLSKVTNGTGPYSVKEWLPDNSVVLVPSETYWGFPPVTPKIEFRWQPDQNRRFSEYDFTQIEGTDFPSIVMTKPFTFMKYIYDNPNLNLVPHTALNLYYLGFNNNIPPFDNVEVRKAVAMALNRADLIDLVFPQGTELAQQIIPTGVNPGRSLFLKWYEPAIADARNKLTDAGFDFNQEITLAFINTPMQTLYSPSALAGEVKKQLEGINLNVTLKPMDVLEFEQSLRDGKEMFYIYWFMADYPDGVAFFEKPFISQSAFLGNPYGDIQKLIYEVRGSTGSDEQQAKFDQLNQLVFDQVPLIPIGHSQDLTVFRSALKNLTANGYYENLEDVISDKNIIRFIGDTIPASLWPADEDDYSTFRITRLIYDTLLAPGFGDMAYEPLLAESWESNENLTEWTFHLRYNVVFSNGSTFDANDVVASFAAIWDASNPNHMGRTGDFALYKRLLGNQINAK